MELPQRSRRRRLEQGGVYARASRDADTERNWARRTKSSSLFEKGFVASRLAVEMVKGDAELRRHFKDGIKLMMRRGIKADAGQLLYLLDAYDFAVFLRRFSSSRRRENYQAFEDASRWYRVPEGNVSPCSGRT